MSDASMPHCNRCKRVQYDCVCEYDAESDFARSIEEAYRAIRERKAAGGTGWVPWYERR
jgi:hypothetical protein